MKIKLIKVKEPKKRNIPDIIDNNYLYENNKDRKLSHNIPKLYIISYVSSLHFISPVLVLFFTDWAGISIAEMMILQAIFMGSMFIFEIPTGTIGDYFGRKKSLACGSMINGIASLIYTIAPKYSYFIVGEILFGLGLTLITGSSEAMLYDTLLDLDKENDAKKTFSKMSSMGLLGISSGALLGSLIASTIGIRETMTYSALPAFGAGILILSLKEPNYRKGKKSEPYLMILKKGLKILKKNEKIKYLSIDIVVVSVVAYYVIWTWQERMRKLNVDLEYFGWIHVILVFSQIFVLNTQNYSEKMIKSNKLHKILFNLMIGIGFIMFGGASNILIVILGIAISAGYGLSYRTIVMSQINKYIPSEQRATIISMIGMLRQFTLMISNPLIGLALDSSLEIVLISFGILMIIKSIIGNCKINCKN